MNSRQDSKWASSPVASWAAAPAERAAPPAAYFISVLELATGEKLGNDERLRAVAMLEAQFGAGRPRTLSEAVRICAGAIDSSTLQRMARGAKA
jgi:hypothetical protein